MIVALDLAHGARHGRMRGEPHQQFYALRPGLFDQLRNGVLRRPFWIVDQALHEGEIEGLVDEAGALCLETTSRRASIRVFSSASALRFATLS